MSGAGRSALRHRDFALLLAAMLAESFALQMSFVAIGWQVYSIGGNALDLGLLGLAEFLPLLLLALALVPVLFRDRIEARAKEEIGRALNARVDWRHVSLSFFRHFPALTLSLDDLTVLGVGTFDGDTLAAVRSFRLVLDVGSVLFGDQTVIRSIDVDAPILRLVVLEDGVEQKVESFHEAVSPVSMVLVLDASGSMRPAAQAATDAAREFIRAIRPTDALAVVIFSDQVIFMHDLTTERWKSFEAIDQYVASGGTALYDAMMDALTRLRKVQGRRAVVVVTDGRDEDNPGTGPGSVATFPEVMTLLRESGAFVFGVGLGPRVDRKPLEEMARSSGGQAYFPADVSTLGVEYQNIVENLRRRWVLSYASTNAKRDGTWRKVEIHLRSSETPVTSAGGYFAPEK